MTDDSPKKPVPWTVAFRDAAVVPDALKRINSLYPLEADRKKLEAQLVDDLENRMPVTPAAVLGWPPQASDVPGISYALRRQGNRLSYLATLDEGQRTILVTRILVS